jgi:hypothetical protein
MEIKVIPYGRIDQGASHRLSIIAWFLAEMASKGLTVQLVHPSHATASAIEASLDVPVLSVYHFSYAHVTADCIAVIDGDIIESRTVDRLKHLRKEVVLIVPTGALPELPTGTRIEDLLRGATLVPKIGDEEEQPKTFGCHHFAPTCGNCASLVMQWQADRRALALSQAT